MFLKQSEKAKKDIKKKLFLPRGFYTLYDQKLSNLRPLLSISFPKDCSNLKSLDIELREVGAKRPLNGLRNTNSRKILPTKQTFFCAAILQPLLVFFLSETTSFHYFFPKDSEYLKILDIRLREEGAKRRFNGTSKVNRQTHIWTN